MLEDACGAMSCAPAPARGTAGDGAPEDANEELRSIEDAADTGPPRDASAAVAAPGGPLRGRCCGAAGASVAARTRYPLLTRFMGANGSRMWHAAPVPIWTTSPPSSSTSTAR